MPEDEVGTREWRASGASPLVLVNPFIHRIRTIYRAGLPGQLTLQAFEIGVRSGVLQLTSNLRLLCLCPAAAIRDPPSQNDGGAANNLAAPFS